MKKSHMFTNAIFQCDANKWLNIFQKFLSTFQFDITIARIKFHSNNTSTRKKGNFEEPKVCNNNANNNNNYGHKFLIQVETSSQSRRIVFLKLPIFVYFVTLYHFISAC